MADHSRVHRPLPLDYVSPPRALPVAGQDCTADEAKATTEAARATAADDNRREQFDYAILFTLLYTSIRRAEVTTLRMSDLEIDRTRLSVLGKGNKVRTVPLPPV